MKGWKVFRGWVLRSELHETNQNQCTRVMYVCVPPGEELKSEEGKDEERRTSTRRHRQVVQCKAACIKVQSTNQSTIKEFIFYEHMHGNYTTRFSTNQMDAPCCVQLDFGTHNANHSSKDNISSPFSFSIPWTTV